MPEALGWQFPIARHLPREPLDFRCVTIFADSSVAWLPPFRTLKLQTQSRGKSSARDGNAPSPVGILKYCGRAFSHSTMLRPEGSYEIRPARIVMRAVSRTFPSILATPQSM